jgi:hypothetical protein
MEFSLQWHTECLNTDHRLRIWWVKYNLRREHKIPHVRYNRIPENMYKRACMIYLVSFFAKICTHLQLTQYKNAVYEEKHILLVFWTNRTTSSL